jgi:MerR family copper efflux transcriptional regulator
MEIHELEALTGVADKTIRYYEQVGVLPPARRKPNGYREYNAQDVERLKFVAGARQLDFSLDDIAEVLALRDRREAPCRFVLDLLEQKAREVSLRIEELKKLKTDLLELQGLGATFPMDDVDGKNCVCHLVSSRIREAENGSTDLEGSQE